jgi:hypothetical protein
LKYFFFNQKDPSTKIINADTSTNGPITPAKACPEFNKKTAIATSLATQNYYL